MSEFDAKAKGWDTPAKEERAEKIARAIRDQVPLKTGMHAFEYGCGTGLLSFALKDDIGSITMADVSEGMLDVLAEKIKNDNTMTAIKLDLLSDPLPTERFELVYTLMTLHHITDTRKIMTRFYELLQPGGVLCIADLDKEDGSFHGKDVDTVHRGFNRDDLAQLTKSIGFKKINFTTAHHMEHTNKHDKTGIFPIFLMTATK